MKECGFEQPFAIFGIYPIYLKKLGKINMTAVTIATSNQEKIHFVDIHQQKFLKNQGNDFLGNREMIFWFNTLKVQQYTTIETHFA